MSPGRAREVREVPATLAGLYEAPCDPLLLAVGPEGAPLPHLTALIDWRLAGRLSRLLRAAGPGDEPRLLPGTPLVPAGRFIVYRQGSVDARTLAACVAALGTTPGGLCPEDFDLRPADLRAAFGRQGLVLYRHADG